MLVCNLFTKPTLFFAYKLEIFLQTQQYGLGAPFNYKISKELENK